MRIGRTLVSAMSKRYAVLWVSAFLAVPLWRELHEPDQLVWNAFLAAFLIASIAAVFFGLRYLEQNNVAVGEARFTSAQHDSDGS